ncbi:MAG: RsmE family RNA methyltransferase [Candidatus Didemnitutus sp.]|nr:RsmE family RNA methyltransferase [Candidatus Didemnitutus sp.]
MNLALFTPEEFSRPLPRSDRRAEHLRRVLHADVGTSFDAGLLNGPRGKATVTALDANTLTLSFTATAPAALADPLVLLLGLPRPQTARDILRDATTLGVSALHFIITERTDANYATSSLWRDGAWRRHVIAGAEQAFSTQIPDVTVGRTLAEALDELAPDTRRLALDNYEAPSSLAGHAALHDANAATPVVLAFGPERGWSAADRAQLRAADFQLAQLGERVLRLETAVIAALTLVKAARGVL